MNDAESRRFARATLALLGYHCQRGRDSIRQVSSDQAMVAKPAVLGRLARFLEENGLLVMALGAFAIVLLIGLRTDLVVDSWLALAAGRWIAQHGLPSHNTLTVVAHGRRWIDQQWLAQLGFYGLWRVGGVKLALLVHALLVTSGLAGAAAIARARGATARSVTWIAIPVFVAYIPVASVLRTQSFAFPLFSATLWLVLADARQPSRRVFATLPLLVLWANLHGSVLLGAALVSLAALVAMLRQRRPTGRSLALLLTPWACVFASPYAVHLPAYYEKILVGGDFKQVVTEWAPTSLAPDTAAVYLLILGGLWLLGRGGRATPALDQLAFALTALLALDALRNMAWVGLVALAVLPQVVDRLRPPAPGQRPLNRLLALAALAVLVVSLVAVAMKPTKWFTPSFPSAAPTATSSAAGPSGKVFATTPYTDWLLWARPELSGRLAFDARLELLSASQLRRLARFEARAGDWLRTANGYRVFVLDPHSDHAVERALIRRLPARIVFSSPQVVVLRRRG
jgi:hypothetical protein